MNYLKDQFLKNFNFSKNVKIQITFLQFDPEWDEYVDLDEDVVLPHKEKLKVVVSPYLAATTNKIPYRQASLCASALSTPPPNTLWTSCRAIFSTVECCGWCSAFELKHFNGLL